MKMNMEKQLTKQQPQEEKEYIIDAAGKILGRVASEVALILQDKKSPSYNPRLIGNVRVVVKNAKKVKISGNKAKQKIYYHHTGYIGHLRARTFEQLFAQSPERVIWKAVYNMLPKNRLRKARMKKLKILQ